MSVSADSASKVHRKEWACTTCRLRMCEQDRASGTSTLRQASQSLLPRESVNRAGKRRRHYRCVADERGRGGDAARSRDDEASDSGMFMWQISFEKVYPIQRPTAEPLSLSMSFYDQMTMPGSVLWIHSVNTNPGNGVLAFEDDTVDSSLVSKGTNA
nr:hypothetical protein CFP56_02632 [Quercus suber]